jgi:gluconolactonase
MKRLVSALLALSLFPSALGCKDDSNAPPRSSTPAQPSPPPPAADNAPSDPGLESSTPPEPQRVSQAIVNPLEGLAAPREVAEMGAFTDGPVWHPGLGELFFTTPLGEGALYRMTPDGSVTKVRDGVSKDGTQPIGNAVTATGDLITVEAKRMMRSPSGTGTPTVLATVFAGFDEMPDDPMNPKALLPPKDGPFDTLNDVIARKDGTLYVTDPGYFAAPIVNRLYRIDSSGRAHIAATFMDLPRPNGIALSPDETKLYVGFTSPMLGTLPFVRAYEVRGDGTLGASTKFVEVGPVDSSPDGLAVDTDGNLYVATRDGIAVYKPDGASWGMLSVPERPTGMAFGGTDRKTMYITTSGKKLWQVSMNVSGLAH